MESPLPKYQCTHQDSSGVCLGMPYLGRAINIQTYTLCKKEVSKIERAINLKILSIQSIAFSGKLDQRRFFDNLPVTLTKLRIEFLLLSCSTFRAFLDFFKKAKHLRTLELGQISDSESGLRKFGIALAKSPALRKLKLSGIYAYPFICKKLARNGSIIALNLSLLEHPSFKPANGYKIFFRNLRGNTTLKSLTLNGSTFNKTSVPELSRYLSTNTTLRSLNINKTGVCIVSLWSLVPDFATNTTLNALSIYGIGRDSTMPFVSSVVEDIIRTNSSLTSLSVRPLVPSKELGAALACNSTLTALNISDPYFAIEVFGDVLIREIIPTNTTLRTLEMDGYSFLPSTLLELPAALAQNTTLTSLSLNQYTPQLSLPWAVFADVARNSTLQELSVNAHIHDRNLSYVQRAFEQNSTLKLININSAFCSGGACLMINNRNSNAKLRDQTLFAHLYGHLKKHNVFSF